MERESRFWEPVKGDVIRCTVCPRKCVIKPGDRGFCGIKENRGGRLYTLTYGDLSAMAVDPIEKKPLAHFYPGSLALSISHISCSFTCPWCQNWHLSTAKPGEIPTRFVKPEEVVEMAVRRRCTSIAYTYNEPIINLDYFEDTARLARGRGVKNVLVTNGYISPEALERVVDVIDAANVDWKSFSDDFYRRYCSGDLKSVLEATVEMKRRGVHVEVTFLIIPGVNDGEEEARAMTRYLVENLGPDTPLHLSKFFPHYKFTHVSPTPVETLMRVREIAVEEGCRYVYVGNVPMNKYENTYCPRCGGAVIERVGYTITDWHLDEENHCEYCGEPIPIVGRREFHPNPFLPL